MRVYWCSHCGDGRNFGDQLTPLLLRHFGIEARWAPADRAELVMVGSVLSAVPNGWRGTVLGTGFIKRSMSRDLRRARVLSVRGELSRNACRLTYRTPLGDPGVLAPYLTDRIGEPTDAIALPHYVDRDLTRLGVPVWPMTSDPLDLIAAVRATKLVHTSSLHGLILADALGVPHVWHRHPAVRGSGWKFADYASALQESMKPGVERLSDRSAMARLQVRAAGWIASLREPNGATESPASIAGGL